MSQLAHWSLTRLPYGPPRKASEFFAGSSQREALARLEYLVEFGRPTALVVGPASVGRTVLMRYVASHGWSAAALQHAIWVEATGTPQDVLDQVAEELGLSGMPLAARWRAIGDETAAAARGGARTVIYLDDADLASEQGLRTLARLVGSCPAISLIAACRSERQASVLQTIGGCPLKVEIQSWGLAEIRDYLQFGLQLAGGRQDVFSDQAVVRLYELSEGLPGVVARMAELALLTGAAGKTIRIGPDLIEAAGNELFQVNASSVVFE